MEVLTGDSAFKIGTYETMVIIMPILSHVTHGNLFTKNIMLF